jgi:hypothetical protein
VQSLEIHLFQEMIKAFSVNERYRGVSLGHTIGSMLMSGTAGYRSLYVMKEYKIMLFPVIYIAFFALVSFFVILNFSKKYNKKDRSNSF